MTKNHDKCSPALAIKEMQIKTTLRFYLTPVRTQTPSRVQRTRIRRGVGKKEPSYTADGNVN
jgi:hypothetical protein